jgi:hypothetical protein
MPGADAAGEAKTFYSNIPVQYAGALMCTRGMLRSTVPPTSTTPVVLRASGGPSVLKELSNEEIAIDIDDALRLNVSALAVQDAMPSSVFPSILYWRPSCICRALVLTWCPALTSSSDSSKAWRVRSPLSQPPPDSAKRRCLPNGLSRAAHLGSPHPCSL